ncbi:MAG: sulfatase-like hydrolase/transferase, partial [Planctomycetaceae bacterium]|nr:sulfatase-like hydrolase/transferase [Planctomycetaceae bacterium]
MIRSLRPRLLFTLSALLMVLPVRAADAPPNIVMIISDDQTWTDYSFMGHPVIQTPHLDRLAARSATFRRGYVPIALCRPSLVTMVTGLYPHQHGVTGNDPWKDAAIPAKTYAAQREQLISKIDSCKTLPTLLLPFLGPMGLLQQQCLRGHCVLDGLDEADLRDDIPSTSRNKGQAAP